MYRRGEVGAVARAFRVLNALRGYKQGRLLADLAVAVGVSERTVRRDLADLTDADLDIELTRVEGRAAACLVESSYSLVSITRRERYTLLAVRSVFDVLRGTPLHDDITSVMAKLEQRMNNAERKEHATMRGLFAYRPGRRHEGVRRQGRRHHRRAADRGSCRASSCATSTRTRAGEPSAATSRPSRCCCTGTVSTRWVVTTRTAARTPLTGAARSASSPLSASPTPITSARAPSTSPRTSRSTKSYMARSESISATRRRHSAPSGRVQPRREGDSRRSTELASGRGTAPHGQRQRARFVLKCTANLVPVVSWVLEWGPHARVFDPPELVSRVVEELDSARRNYPS